MLLQQISNHEEWNVIRWTGIVREGLHASHLLVLRQVEHTPQFYMCRVIENIVDAADEFISVVREQWLIMTVIVIVCAS